MPLLRKREIDHLNSNLIPCHCGCGKLIHSIGKDGKPTRFISGHNIGKGKKCPFYKNGRQKHMAGYIWIMKPEHHFADKRGRILEHRFVWEEYHKAILLPWVDCHHVNGIKNDNRIENLEAMTRSKHLKYHNEIRRRNIANTH